MKYIIRSDKDAKSKLQRYSMGLYSSQEATVVEEWFLCVCNTIPSEYTVEQEMVLKQAVWEEIQSKFSGC